MSNIQTKASVFAIVEEVTEGTPVKPTLATQYIALQDDAEMTPDAESLENAEFKNSIGKSKPIKGAENPTGSLSHYLKSSGTVAVAPAYGPFLKAWFGTEGIRVTERDTVAASTTSVLKVDAGEGVEFSKGHFVLGKDGINGYFVRAIESVAGDDLTMGFNVANAPASGVNLGRDVRYSPAQTGHVSLSLWHFLGNGGATQLISGAKLTEFGFEASAGELVNANFSFEGLEYFFNPIKITATNKFIDFDEGAAEINVFVDEKTYKTPTQLLEAIAVAMDAAAAATITAVYSRSTGKTTIVSDGATLNILWKTGVNGADNTDFHIGTELGYSDLADGTGGLTYISDSALDLASPQTPTYNATDPIAAKGHEIMLGDAADFACFPVSNISFTGSNTRTVNGDICAPSGQGSANITEREIEISLSALLDQYDDQQFDRFEKNSEVKFQYTFGQKSAGNWVEGETMALYIGAATITAINVEDADGVVQITITLKAFVNDTGDGEAFIGQV